MSGQSAQRTYRADEIPRNQASIVGVNIRQLRERNGWSQAKLARLMGWLSSSTVCAAEGRRGGQQRGFTMAEVEQLAAILAVSTRQLTTGCANCGFACQASAART